MISRTKYGTYCTEVNAVSGFDQGMCSSNTYGSQQLRQSVTPDDSQLNKGASVN
jgi:hypothetical protein